MPWAAWASKKEPSAVVYKSKNGCHERCYCYSSKLVLAIGIGSLFEPVLTIKRVLSVTNKTYTQVEKLTFDVLTYYIYMIFTSEPIHSC